jgi:RNA polymerase sigma-70 factor (ECF subfamily)
MTPMTHPGDDAALRAALAGDQEAFAGLTEPHRRELRAHCYRMLGSPHDAEDIVQETFLRAWRRLSTYEGRSTFRAWLYKIATNACLDELQKRPRRLLPASLDQPSDPDKPPSPPMIESAWLEPCSDAWLGEPAAPEGRFDQREAISLAFLVALQQLPARQRAVLILRDVLEFSAAESAGLLDVTVSSANSALHRARTALTQHYTHPDAVRADDAAHTQLLRQYVQAWERADVAALIALLKRDATLSMPPSTTWWRGAEAIGAGLSTFILPPGAVGLWRLSATSANGQPAFGLYQRDESGQHRLYALQVLTVERDAVVEIVNFLDPSVVARFRLPERV